MHTSPGRSVGSPVDLDLEDTRFPFSERTELGVRAFYLGERLDPKAVRGGRITPAPFVLPAGRAGAALLFRYGAAVLFHVEDDELDAALAELRASITQPFEQPETEAAELVVRSHAHERAADGVIRVRDLSFERLQLVADVLAKSVVLAHYEAATQGAVDRLEPLAQSLSRGRTARRRARGLLEHIGTALMVETQTVARVEILEKPDVLWDHPELERFYARLSDEYELAERHVALDRKLMLISRTAQTVLELLQHARSLRVEWYIVILILVEILLTLYELFVHRALPV